MDRYLDTPQIDEFIPLDWDDEETRYEVEEFYDDLAAGLPLDSANDF